MLAERDARGQFGHVGMDQLVIADDALDGLHATVERQLARSGRTTRIRTAACGSWPTRC